MGEQGSLSAPVRVHAFSPIPSLFIKGVYCEANTGLELTTILLPQIPKY